MGFGLLEGWRVIESEYWSVGKLYGALERRNDLVLDSSRVGELYGRFRPRQRARFIKQYLLYNDILLILQVAPKELNFLLCNVLLTGRHSVASKYLLLLTASGAVNKMHTFS